MTLEEYASCDAIALAALVRSGEVMPEEMRNAALAAVAAVNPLVNAVIETWEDEPLASVGEDDNAPLLGVPFLFKDLAITAKGRRSEAGSRFASGLAASSDSDLMTWFRAAGMTPIGRTTTPELAISTTTEPIATGATRNPWDTDRTSGGSSGGSGAAVAAACVPIAHGTDAGGSLRVPASSNGVFALKPSRGRVPNGPAFDEIWSGVGVQFALTRSVRDSALLLDAVGRPGTGEPFVIAPPMRPYLDEVSREPGKLRIALMRDPLNGQRTDPAVRRVVDEVAQLCSDLGHAVEEIVPELGMTWEAFTLAYARIEAANTTAMLDGIAAQLGKSVTPDDLEPSTWAMVEYGRSISAVDLLGAFDARNTVTRRIGAFLAEWDVLLSPTLAELPLPIGEYNRPQATLDGLGWARYVSDRAPFSSLANVGGLPAMSVPLSVDEATGLPIGSQFIAGSGREDLLFRLAGQLERAAPWAARRPPVWAGGTLDRAG